MGQVGKWAFIGGIVLAVVAAFVTQTTWIYWVLAVLGLVVGFLNVTAEETKGFLLSAVPDPVGLGGSGNSIGRRNGHHGHGKPGRLHVGGGPDRCAEITVRDRERLSVAVQRR